MDRYRYLGDAHYLLQAARESDPDATTVDPGPARKVPAFIAIDRALSALSCLVTGGQREIDSPGAVAREASAFLANVRFDRERLALILKAADLAIADAESAFGGTDPSPEVPRDDGPVETLPVPESWEANPVDIKPKRHRSRSNQY